MNPDGHGVMLSFEIQGGADPNEYAAVYVSDNPLGPALLIDALTAHANLMPGSNQWVDNLRLPPADEYYYWLDFDDQPFAAKRAPQGLYPATNVPVFVSGTSFTGFTPPWITSIVDTPFDRGGSLTVNWSAPNGHEDADGFNIYRHSYPGGQPEYDEWRVIGWTDPYTLSYPDVAPTGWVNEYKVSIAHHGNSVPQTGDGNTGIWNSFSSVVAGSPIDNFAIDQITLLSNDTLRVCPAGHDGTLEVEEIIWGNVGGPTVGIPPEMLVCYLEADSVITCDGDTLVVDGPTDGAGRTTLTASKIGGHGRADLEFALANSYTTFDAVTVYFKSPDENGDGAVGASDFAAWSTSYQSPPKTYQWHRDFNDNGNIGIGDFAYMYQHFGHGCGSGALLVRESESIAATVALKFTEVVSASAARLFYADVSVVGLPGFTAMVVGLRAENPSLEFVRWEPGRFAGDILVTPATRDGVKEIAFGVMGDASFVAGTADLGRLVFAIKSAGEVALSQSDFEVRVADVVTSSGTSKIGSSASSSDRAIHRAVIDALSQNVPNPFNPTTTIAFSLANASDTELRIFDVRGAAVRTLVNDRRQAGLHRVEWNGQNDNGQTVASGVYFYRLVAGSFTDTKKMTILK